MYCRRPSFKGKGGSIAGRMFGLAAVAAVLLWTAAGPALAADVDVQVTQERADGYRAEVVIRNPGERRITDWSLEFTADRPIERAWGAEMSRTGENRYRFRPDPWTREIAAGGQAKFTLAGPPSERPLDPRSVEVDARYAATGTPASPPSSAAAAAPKPPPQPPAKPEIAAKPKPAAKPTPAAPERKPAARQREADQVASRDAGRSVTSVKHTLAFKLQSSWDSGFTAEMVVINASERTLKPWRLEFELNGDIIEMWNADFRKVGNHRYVVTPKSYNDEIDPNGFATFGFKTSTAYASRPEDSRLSAVN